jgi:hypothetical protein
MLPLPASYFLLPLPAVTSSLHFPLSFPNSISHVRF